MCYQGTPAEYANLLQIKVSLRFRHPQLQYSTWQAAHCVVCAGGSSGTAQPALAADASSSQGAGGIHASQGEQQQPKPVPTVKKEGNAGGGATYKIAGQRNVVSMLQHLGLLRSSSSMPQWHGIRAGHAAVRYVYLLFALQLA